MSIVQVIVEIERTLKFMEKLLIKAHLVFAELLFIMEKFLT
jgi:hypothetical protein